MGNQGASGARSSDDALASGSQDKAALKELQERCVPKPFRGTQEDRLAPPPVAAQESMCGEGDQPASIYRKVQGPGAQNQLTVPAQVPGSSLAVMPGTMTPQALQRIQTFSCPAPVNTTTTQPMSLAPQQTSVTPQVVASVPLLTMPRTESLHIVPAVGALQNLPRSDSSYLTSGQQNNNSVKMPNPTIQQSGSLRIPQPIWNERQALPNLSRQATADKSTAFPLSARVSNHTKQADSISSTQRNVVLGFAAITANVTASPSASLVQVGGSLSAPTTTLVSAPSFSPIPAVGSTTPFSPAAAFSQAVIGSSVVAPSGSTPAISAPVTASYAPPPAGVTKTTSYAPHPTTGPSGVTTPMASTLLRSDSVRRIPGQVSANQASALTPVHRQTTASYAPPSTVSSGVTDSLLQTRQGHPSGQFIPLAPGQTPRMTSVPTQALGSFRASWDGIAKQITSARSAVVDYEMQALPSGKPVPPPMAMPRSQSIGRAQGCSLRALPGQGMTLTPGPSFTAVPAVGTQTNGSSIRSQPCNLSGTVSRTGQLASESLTRAESFHRTENGGRSLLQGSLTTGTTNCRVARSVTPSRNQKVGSATIERRYVSASPARPAQVLQVTPGNNAMPVVYGDSVVARTVRLTPRRGVEAPPSMSQPAAGGAQMATHVKQAPQSPLADEGEIRSDLLGDRARGVFSRIQELEAELARLQNFTFLPDMSEPRQSQLETTPTYSNGVSVL